MIKLIKIEWSKLKKYNAFKALMLVYIFAVPLMNIGVASLDLDSILPNMHILGYPTVYWVTSWLASCLNLVMSVIIVSIACNEFVFKTFRQNAIDGLNKKQLILSKFLVILLLSFFIALYTFVVSATTGLFYSDFGDIMNGIDSILVYFIQTLGYFSLAFLFAVLLKKPSLAIIIFILTIIFDGITIGLAMTPHYFVYFPTEVFSNLTPFPFFKELIKQVKNEGVEVIQLSTTVAISLSLVYSAIILFISYKILQKRDL